MTLDEEISEVLAKVEADPGKLIEALQMSQELIGYLPKEAIEAAARRVNVPISRAYGVATFYHQFRLKPVGKHQAFICFGTACHVKGAPSVYDAFGKALGLEQDETTSSDSRFTLYKVRCLGACSMAPVVKIDNDIYGKMTTAEARKLSAKYR